MERGVAGGRARCGGLGAEMRMIGGGGARCGGLGAEV